MGTQFLTAAATVLVAACRSGSGAELPADISDMTVREMRAGGDAMKRYFVIHRPVDPPKDGWRTLFVLPGGSGDAQFQPFVTRIAKNALPENYLVVQLVAPVWSPQQAENVVWPTDQSNLREVKFSTREFFLAVRSEVGKAHKLDPRYSFTLTWSSSGTNGYGLSLSSKSGVTGTFVAMSVFTPALLPPLTAAKGHPYFIYHSPTDFIPIANAEAARDALEKAGAVVKLQTYDGGHGWKGDVFGDIRKGVHWLEQQAKKTN
jgi:predicted esterase